MITLCLVAVGISGLVFLLALRGAGDGHEDKAGFHPAPLPVIRSSQAISLGATARAGQTRTTRANHWRQLPVHGQDEIDLLMACAVNRASLVRGILIEWAVPPLPAGNHGMPRTPFAWIRRRG